MSWQFPWNKSVCVRCQKELAADWVECPYCGTQVGSGEAMQPAATQTSGGASAAAQSWLHPSTEPMPPHLRDAPIQSVSGPNLAWLVPLDGPNMGRLFEVVGRVLIGAGEGCTIRLDDPSISGRHAEIVLGPQNRFRMTDLGSRNGTYLNDRQVTSEELVDGDNIRMGRTTFRFKTRS